MIKSMRRNLMMGKKKKSKNKTKKNMKINSRLKNNRTRMNNVEGK